uniref:Proteasome-associated ATPase n=1 Tax=Zeugodacus cucurbitae TaxID=28588 RepID=A0A0A1X0P7_ZEUCU
MVKKLIIFGLITVVCQAACAPGTTNPDLSVDDASFTIFVDAGKEIEKLINLVKVTESRQITIEDMLQKTSEENKRLDGKLSDLSKKICTLSEKLDKLEKLSKKQRKSSNMQRSLPVTFVNPQPQGFEIQSVPFTYNNQMQQQPYVYPLY